MGAWGIKALESDEGLDLLDAFTAFFLKNPNIESSSLILFLKEEGLLPQNSAEIDFLFDNSAMALAELIRDYDLNGRIVLKYFDDQDAEITKHVTELTLAAQDIDFLLAIISDILEPLGASHETVDLWRDSDSFDEWRDHVVQLTESLRRIRIRL